MIKLSQEDLERLEAAYPGIAQTIEEAEAQAYPNCPGCGESLEVATVLVGMIGRTIGLASATSRIHLVPNSERKPGSFYCGKCDAAFDDEAEQDRA